MMSEEEYVLFNRFTKIKPHVFYFTESEYAYDFIIDGHERLHKMGEVERHGVEGEL